MTTECVKKRIYEMTRDEFKIHQTKEVEAEVKEFVESSKNNSFIKTLEALNVELIDANNEYRSVYDILYDIANSDIWKCRNRESNKELEPV